MVPLEADQYHSTRFTYIGDRGQPDDLGNSRS